MQVLKKIAVRLKYFTCPEGGDHQGQSLNYVCLDKSCKKLGLLCSICKNNHQNHTIVPLKVLLTELKNHKEKPMDDSQGFQNQLEQLQNKYQILMLKLRSCVQDLAQQYRKLEEHIHEQFTKMKVELLERVQINMKFNVFIDQALRNQIECRQVFAADINRIASMVSLNQQNQLKYHTNLNSVIDKFDTFKILTENKLTNITKLVHSQKLIIEIQKIQQKDKNEIKQKPNVDTPLKKKNYQFSPNNKATTISIFNGNLMAKQSKSGQGRFVFVNKGTGSQNQMITFKIKSLKNWIGLGIGLIDKLKQLKYRFQYNEIGHGSFLLSSNGYSWSHSEKTENVKVVSFKFKEGDLVDIHFTGKQLKFLNKMTKQSFTLNTKLDKKEQKSICFCANLCSDGDTVEIINQ